jgi:anti-sigma factor RsiW
MSHLGERIAEFVLGEMTSGETAEAKAHLSQCPDCARQVAEFQRTHALLMASPDTDLPRPVVFEFEKPVKTPLLWRWFPPLASAAAASVLTVFLMTPGSAPQPAEEPALVEMKSELEALRGYVALLEKKQTLTQKETEAAKGAVSQLLAQRSVGD